MKHIYQKNGTDCGVACVAMVAKVSYKTAYRACGFSKRDKKQLTSTKQLRAALQRLGVKTYPRLRPFRKKQPNDLEHNAILKVDHIGRMWHWVAYDAKKQIIFDPAKDNILKNIHSYLEVLP